MNCIPKFEPYAEYITFSLNRGGFCWTTSLQDNHWYPFGCWSPKPYIGWDGMWSSWFLLSAAIYLHLAFILGWPFRFIWRSFQTDLPEDWGGVRWPRRFETMENRYGFHRALCGCLAYFKVVELSRYIMSRWVQSFSCPEDIETRPCLIAFFFESFWFNKLCIL